MFYIIIVVFSVFLSIVSVLNYIVSCAGMSFIKRKSINFIFILNNYDQAKPC